MATEKVSMKNRVAASARRRPAGDAAAIGPANQAAMLAALGNWCIGDQCGQKTAFSLVTRNNRADLGRTKPPQENSCVRFRFL